jgi:hypothetical protein
MESFINQTIKITFDKPIQLTNGTLTCESASVTIEGSESDYTFDWELDPSCQHFNFQKDLFINLKLKISLKGDLNEAFIFNITREDLIKDEFGNTLDGAEEETGLQEYNYISAADRAAVDNIGSSAVASFLSGVLVFLVLCLVL